jgi:hypothetical protein
MLAEAFHENIQSLGRFHPGPHGSIRDQEEEEEEVVDLHHGSCSTRDASAKELQVCFLYVTPIATPSVTLRCDLDAC